ncbi:DNA cytosine methyltransferase [Klugiella xanthotipulae]
MYAQHFDTETEAAAGTDHTFALGDITHVTAEQIPGPLALAWASFPCTDLSLAGGRAGLDGSASATFWHFTRILREMGEARPAVIALENVVGFATSRGGDDLAAAIRELNKLGYSVDVITLDARRFVPQSRPRLFLVGALAPPRNAEHPQSELRPDWLQAVFGDPTLRTHRAELPAPPPPLTAGLGEMVEKISHADERWWDDTRLTAFLTSLSPVQAERVERLRRGRVTSYRTAYRRTRNGVAVWEVRPDDIAGCLRTARGGSSKQAVVKIGHGRVRVRWMTPLEYARLMGAGDYTLGTLRNNQLFFGFGDAVCVPTVEWLARNYLRPLSTGTLGSAPASGSSSAPAPLTAVNSGV